MVKTLRLASMASATIFAGALLSASPAMAQALSGSAAAPQAKAARTGDEVDRIIAVVDNGVITERQLDRRVAMVKRRLQGRSQLPSDAELRKQVLNQMVVTEIQLQKAESEGIHIDDAAVDATLTRLAQSNGLPLDQFRARIEAENVPWTTFRSDARDEMTLAELRRRDVDSKITVSDAEVANYIASQHGITSAPNDLHLQHLLVAVPAGAPEADVQAAEKRAEKVIADARDGRDFARLAKSNSQAGDAKAGGDLGFKAPDALPKPFVDAVATIAPGQVVPEPIRTADGWEVVRLVERRASSSAASKITQTHVSHILLRVGEGSSEADVVSKLQRIKRDIEAGKGTFAEYARSNSQDGSAGQGGDLGWINPGQTVPDFERVMNQLQPGQISNPVRSEYGYHLILVQGRRESVATPAEQEDAARQAVGSRKSEQAYADWLRELYDSAYIKTMLDTTTP
ncbi:peptidylprolyl isomerase [Robbsia sp. Bb-Pol-6]|uniref:Chaperone SurA n=1 Tax=Robbsia betulipollinis TaxID=2981849 RepID=A0ABT3ZLF2_9BURK|nr:peptidylprolyl isomerase [Robbsia betulipollinis]MCY0387368.1 peptidylprolyl isomerase [Robbsia betulipollinis]